MFKVRTAASNDVEVWISGNADINNAGTIATSTWTHVAATRSGTALTLYINGVSAGTGTDGTSLTFTCDIYIGFTSATACTSSLSERFDGLIDDVRVYNRALSAAEIRQLYNLGR